VKGVCAAAAVSAAVRGIRGRGEGIVDGGAVLLAPRDI